MTQPQLPPSRLSVLGRIPDELKPGGEFDRFVAQLAAEDKFSGTFLLTYKGKTVLERSYGMANIDQEIPNRLDTIFGLASVNKLFTGAAVAQLAQRGKVGYYEKLGTYLDGFPSEVAETVTVHHLLTHTSGVGRVSSDPEPPPGSDEWDTPEEVWDGTLAYLRTLPLRFTPGAEYQYSNDGYFLLDAIVAEVSGQSFDDYRREHIFEPAGMKSTGVYSKKQRLTNPRIAHTYATSESNGHIDMTGELPLWKAAGDPYSSAPDLVRFARAMQNNALVNPAYTDLTVSPKLPTSSGGEIRFETYGPGAFFRGGQWVLGHSGGGGMSANLDWFPNSGWIVAVLSNYDQGLAGIVEKARDLISTS